MAKTADYGLGEHTFPRGWFMVATSDEVTTTPLAVRYFGEEMVLYRGGSGRVFLVEAFCPHMGTHLAKNTSSDVVVDKEHVEGDNIRCPYHGWRFGPDGRCNDIPYSPAPIPKAACLKSWKVLERAGCIWAWHDAEGGEPDYDVPPFEQWNQPGWVNWSVEPLGELACHPQEVLDNMTDKGHLQPVHGSIDMVKFENEFNGHVCRQILTAALVVGLRIPQAGLLQALIHDLPDAHVKAGMRSAKTTGEFADDEVIFARLTRRLDQFFCDLKHSMSTG